MLKKRNLFISKKYLNKKAITCLWKRFNFWVWVSEEYGIPLRKRGVQKPFSEIFEIYYLQNGFLDYLAPVYNIFSYFLGFKVGIYPLYVTALRIENKEKKLFYELIFSYLFTRLSHLHDRDDLINSG